MRDGEQMEICERADVGATAHPPAVVSLPVPCLAYEPVTAHTFRSGGLSTMPLYST